MVEITIRLGEVEAEAKASLAAAGLSRLRCSVYRASNPPWHDLTNIFVDDGAPSSGRTGIYDKEALDVLPRRIGEAVAEYGVKMGNSLSALAAMHEPFRDHYRQWLTDELAKLDAL